MNQDIYINKTPFENFLQTLFFVPTQQQQFPIQQFPIRQQIQQQQATEAIPTTTTNQMVRAKKDKQFTEKPKKIDQQLERRLTKRIRHLEESSRESTNEIRFLKKQVKNLNVLLLAKEYT